MSTAQTEHTLAAANDARRTEADPASVADAQLETVSRLAIASDLVATAVTAPEPTTAQEAIAAMVAMAEIPGEPGILDQLVTSARRILDARSGLALLIGSDGAASGMAHQGLTAAQVQAMPLLPYPSGLIGLVAGGHVTTGQVVRLDRLTDHPATSSSQAANASIGPLLATPIGVNGAVIGALYLARQSGEATFTVHDEATIGGLARMAGLVIATRRRLTGDRGVLDGLTTLGVPGSGDQSPISLDDSIDHLLDATRTVLEVDIAFLSRIGVGQQRVTHVSTRAGAPAVNPGMCVPEESGYCSWMLRGDLPSSVPDTAAHPLAASLPLTFEVGVGSYNGVPVQLGDGTIHGTLCTLDRAATSTTDGASRSEALRVVSRLIALQIDRHRAGRERTAEDRLVLEPLLDGTRRTTALQPIVALDGTGPVGYEALSRFTDVHGGPLRPDLVFAEATRLGLGVRLEQAALASALHLLPRIPTGRYLSVNLSPAALAAPATHDLLMTVPADRVLLEVTEHEAIPDYPSLGRLLDLQRNRGMRIAIDDAGSGYASLQHLTRLRPDVIKLDISLVRGIDTDLNCRAMARALIAYAQETGATLVAEGIETPAERDELTALGAHLGQGFLLGRPQSAEELLP